MRKGIAVRLMTESRRSRRMPPRSPVETQDTVSEEPPDTSTEPTGSPDVQDEESVGDTRARELPLETAVVEELAAGYCSADGEIENEHGGCTGPGYVNTENSIGAIVE